MPSWRPGTAPPSSPATLHHMIGFGARSLIAQAFAVTGEEARAEEMPALEAIFLEHYRDHLADFSRPFPGVEETLARLQGRTGRRLGVLTNKPHQLAGPLLERLDLMRFFPLDLWRGLAGLRQTRSAHLRRCGGGAVERQRPWRARRDDRGFRHRSADRPRRECALHTDVVWLYAGAGGVAGRR